MSFFLITLIALYEQIFPVSFLLTMLALYEHIFMYMVQSFGSFVNTQEIRFCVRIIFFQWL